MKIVDEIVGGRFFEPTSHSAITSKKMERLRAHCTPVIDVASVGPMVQEKITRGATLETASIIAVPPFENTLLVSDSALVVDGDFPERNVPLASLVDSGCLSDEILCAGAKEYMGLTVTPSVGSMFHVAHFFAMPDRVLLTGWGEWVTDQHGRILSSTKVPRDCLSEEDARCGTVLWVAEQSGENLLGVSRRALHLTLLSLTLLNCKNVHAREQPCSPKLAKRYQERHGHKRPRYYVLDIEPMRQKFRDANGGKDGISLAKALHICRGHFKDYREKPLFGKVSGMFWWQPHVRGTAEAGIVEKDYRIKLGSEAPHR